MTKDQLAGGRLIELFLLTLIWLVPGCLPLIELPFAVVVEEPSELKIGMQIGVLHFRHIRKFCWLLTSPRQLLRLRSSSRRTNSDRIACDRSIS